MNNPLKSEDIKNPEIAGVQKAALLLIALNIETASTVFKYLDPEQVEKISAQIDVLLKSLYLLVAEALSTLV